MARPGQALVEYILVIAIVAVMLITSLVFFQKTLGASIEDIDVSKSVNCPSPGHGGAIPGQGGTAPGQCR